MPGFSKDTSSISGASARQREMQAESESDAAFVERMSSPDIALVDLDDRQLTDDQHRLIALARREAQRERTGAPVNEDRDFPPSDQSLADQIREHASIIYECGSDYSRDALFNIARQITASRAVSMPDAGAEDVTDAMVEAFSDEWTNPSYSPQMRTGERIKLALRAALAVMPRRDDRAGLPGMDWRLSAESEAQMKAIDQQGAGQTILPCGTPTPEQGEQEGWRPIETAPKDGTWILVYVVPHAKAPAVVKWVEDAWHINELPLPFGVTCEIIPTHWMPLPAAPGASK